jgi:flagellar assembly factor FliW
VKGKIVSFLHSLILYDYILFGAIFALFIMLIVLAIVLRQRLVLAISLVVFSFVFLFLGSIVDYTQMHKYLYKSSLTLTSQKRLTFIDAVVVKGIIKNESKFNFKSCVITAKVFKSSDNKLKNYIYQFKPLRKMSILKQDIPIGSNKDFKIIVEPFRYKKDYNISLEADCKP